MSSASLDKHDRRVPRYTSYPTAPHFNPGVGADTYSAWLAEIPPSDRLSIYVHIPFCDTLCWFCGCHTRIVNRYAPVAGYLAALRLELDLVAQRLGSRRHVGHVHWGGGSPTILSAADIRELADAIRERFDVLDDAELAVEIDPRGLDDAKVAALARAGVTRASLGVQDVSPTVQQAINRHQPVEVTARAADALRTAGLGSISVDLMYGLPHQTVESVVASAQAILALTPDRVALFGYAHVPWMKRHQRLIDEAALPSPADRLRQLEAASRAFRSAGYVAVGLDHFARPADGLAIALAEGRLHRNFQGYTTDAAGALIGLGASAIGALPQGYVQNAVSVAAYRGAVERGRFAVERGVELDDDDRLRRGVIERLMCDLRVDLKALCRAYGRPPDFFADELRALQPMVADGTAMTGDGLICVREEGRPFVRAVCAVFDRYLRSGAARHSQVV